MGLKKELKSGMGAFEQIDIHKAKELMDRGEATIVDIRDPEAYKQAHIPKAIPVTDETLPSFLKTTDKKKPLICYCYHGISSQSAAQYFQKEGFQKVFSIVGGFEEWRTIYPTQETRPAGN
jgi:thiosulfate sulfurtransferase